MKKITFENLFFAFLNILLICTVYMFATFSGAFIVLYIESGANGEVARSLFNEIQPVVIVLGISMFIVSAFSVFMGVAMFEGLISLITFTYRKYIQATKLKKETPA